MCTEYISPIEIEDRDTETETWRTGDKKVQCESVCRMLEKEREIYLDKEKDTYLLKVIFLFF